ncbi:MAG: hypothetical protein WCE75_15445 [Terracidiphilus sp.]
MRLRWVLALLLLAAAAAAVAEPDARVRVEFSHPGLIPGHWVLTLAPDGSGHFRSERGPAQVENPQLIDAPDVDRDIRVSSAFAGHVFETARRHQLFNTQCESHLKIAFQGWKTLTYTGPEGQGSCQFNYARDREIQAIGDALVAVAGSILEGARLEKFLQHDRLGLDKEMEWVADAVGEGRFQQICAIRGILERLAEDPDVMERVRKRARMLLARAEQ